MTSFAEAVYEVVKAIPKGHVMTYGEVAARAGFPGAARAVGTTMKNNAYPYYKKKTSCSVPCHRVVKSNGEIGQYNGAANMKKKLLQQEGVEITSDNRIILK